MLGIICITSVQEIHTCRSAVVTRTVALYFTDANCETQPNECV
jgi:hypothetical protein